MAACAYHHGCLRHRQMAITHNAFSALQLFVFRSYKSYMYLLLYMPVSVQRHERAAAILRLKRSAFRQLVTTKMLHLMPSASLCLFSASTCLKLSHNIVAVSAFTQLMEISVGRWKKCGYHVAIEVVTLLRCMCLLQPLVAAEMHHWTPFASLKAWL